MRLLALASLTLVIIGCSNAEVKPPAGASDASRKTDSPRASGQTAQKSNQPAHPRDALTWITFRGVFLKCKASQEAARNALQALPEVQELRIDPGMGTIFLKAPFRIVDAGQVVRALHGTGLHGHYEWFDPIVGAKFEYVGQSVFFPAGEPKPVDRVTLHIFAGSPESQEAIRKALAPSRVTIMGADAVKSIGIEGKSLLAHKEVEKLFKAGFFASVHEDPWPGEKKPGS